MHKRGQSGQEYKAQLKSAYKFFVLRWHPDKFMGKYGAKMKEEEKEKIRATLNDNIQTINASFTQLMSSAA